MITSAGNVKIAPAATASPADAIVCTKLFSRIVDPPSVRRIAIEMTAAGMLAETVRPAYRPRYAFALPRISASATPSTIPRAVNSRGAVSAVEECSEVGVATASLYAIVTVAKEAIENFVAEKNRARSVVLVRRRRGVLVAGRFHARDLQWLSGVLPAEGTVRHHAHVGVT